MVLTAVTANQAKPKDMPYKLADEKGMYLYVVPKGFKYWRLKYRFAGKEKSLALGVYPEISLKEAREKRDEARKNPVFTGFFYWLPTLYNSLHILALCGAPSGGLSGPHGNGTPGK